MASNRSTSARELEIHNKYTRLQLLEILFVYPFDHEVFGVFFCGDNHWIQYCCLGWRSA